ncbi:hypothetical protein PCC9214_02901 [Planktothrix tepida]|uniref:Uncharacterized protein n=1 Tax=Planktothrix tepida PCC 9214 TaxID=671072 RepID=A0A1J1LR93_9CYAN|nr:hypothetical protein [Planktothrix tepida]CAD5956525.1 hypothetical protein PCC9214_02901 [Planktothrix tepida]CUR34097.1 hypothetical protein PL9214640104 [Planktothrix tepida PCC 9214]
METNHKNSHNNTEKISKDIHNNSLFTDITAEEEVFVRGGKVGVPPFMRPT